MCKVYVGMVIKLLLKSRAESMVAESVEFSGTTGTMAIKFPGFPISEVK